MEKVWLYAAIGGLAPTIFWLIFWMREDINQKEPIRLILKTFIFGALAAFTAVALQTIFSNFLDRGIDRIILFSFIEEFVKFSAVILVSLGTVWNNEREDPMIYMIAGALGFAAIENIYYILDYLKDLRYIETLIDGGYRFIGASLLHIITSATIGIFISLVFFKRKRIRVIMSIVGLFVATIIHSVFNLLVMSSDSFYQNMAFYGAWVLIIILLIIFEFIDSDNKYRIIKDGVVYASKRPIVFSDEDYYIKIPISTTERIIVENKNIKILEDDESFNNYKKDPFRKKFF